MNKIYKLIWSKVKNMWVVASELAKSHTKSPNSGIVGVASLASLESKINMDLSKGFVAGVFPMVNRPIAKLSDFKITVAAIVKNEAENVPTWVQAARSCADEIVVVDTGSTDGTVERFADYGIKCFHYDWHDDFASAKNYMISLCHGDWIVLLDGDEWFREGCDVRKAIAKHHGNPITKAIIADWICLDKDRNNAVMFSGGAVRAFRNQPDVRYFRKVHENLTINYENFVFEPDFKMYHTGYSGSVNRSKHERNLRIMRTMFDFDNGKVEFPTDWRYIEDTYAGLGQFDKALWAADKMISFGVQEYSAAAWITKFNVLFAMKIPLAEMKKQFEYCFKTVPSVSGFRFLASIYYFRNGLVAEGLDNYIEGLRMLMGPQDKVAMEHTYWRMYMPEASALASAVYLQNKQVEAALYASKVCEQCCGQTDWTNRALADVRRVMNQAEEGLLGNIKERVLPVLQFSKKAVLATALASSLTIGMVNNAYAAYTAGCGSASGNNAISIGNGSTTTNTNANGSYSIAIGSYANSPGLSSTAIGYNARAGSAVASYALSLGAGAFASASCSVAIGYNSTANSENEISFGHANGDLDANGNAYYGSLYRKLVNVADGTDDHDVVTVGQLNTALANVGSPCFADGVVLGGCNNTASGCYSSVAGGNGNDATGFASFAAGGCNADAKGNRSTAIGGSCGTAEGEYSLLLGGSKGHAYADYSTAIGGGITGVSSCSTTAKHSVAVGWGAKTTTDYQVTIGSCSAPVKIDGALIVDGTKSITDGTTTRTWSDFLLAGGGGACFANGMVLSGCNNTASGCYSSVAGGCYNRATGDYSSVSGGRNNGASEQFSSVFGGINNSALCYASSVSGGCGNFASGCASSIAGGISNQAIGIYSFVAGGCCNIASGCCSTVVGGVYNDATGNESSVFGGSSNLAGAGYTFRDLQGRLIVLEPDDTRINKSVNPPTITIDDWNPETSGFQSMTYELKLSYGNNSTAVGGYDNSALGYLSTVVGGCLNSAVGNCSTVVGGERSIAYAQYSTVIGGGITGNAECATTALGSVAIGKNATTTRDYEVTIGSSCAPVTIGGNMTVTGTQTVTDGTTTKSWTEVLSGGSPCFADGAVLAGCNNTASGCYSSVSGGVGNIASGDYSSILGGNANKVSGRQSTIVGGNYNIASLTGSSILGGCGNAIEPIYTYDYYGQLNIAHPDDPYINGNVYSIGGGEFPLTLYNKSNAVIVGGECNYSSGFNSVVGGGSSNIALGNNSFVAGGSSNKAVANNSTVIAGTMNDSLNGANNSLVAGGMYNHAYSCYSTVLGGSNNSVYGVRSTAIGGCCGIAYACESIVIGGGITGIEGSPETAKFSVAIGKGATATINNQVAIGSSSAPVKIGGNLTVTGTQTVTDGTTTKSWTELLSGGSPCFADGVVLAGCNNTASGSYSSVVGGWCNTASGCYASISGGFCNMASCQYSSVSGGVDNIASGPVSSVSGGQSNIASGNGSSVSGGNHNTASSWYSSISGGFYNTASGNYSSVIGGRNSFAYACFSTAIGGGITGNAECSTTALESVAIGKNATTTRDYEVAIGSSCAPVKIDGALTVDGAKNITDGTITKTWAEVLEGGSLPNTLALGTCGTTAACASGTNSIAIGEGAVASGDKAISIGTGNQVRGDNSGAFGDPNIVDANNSYTVGNNSTISANVDGAFVLGNNVTVNNGTLPDNWNSLTDKEKSDITGEGVIALGNNVSVSLCNKVNSSRSSNSTGSPKIQHVVAIGDSAIVGEENAVALGYQAEAKALNALAGGTCAKALSEGATALGQASVVHENSSFATAVGYEAEATGEGANAFGDNANAGAKFATAFGRSTRALAESATAIGNSAHAVTQSSVAIGTSAVANGGSNTNAVAIGRGATIGSDTQGYGESVALGGGSNVQNTYGTALGSGASVSGQRGTAVGYNASVTAANAVALGADSVADTADTVSVGATDATRKIVNVTNGSADTDVSTVGQTGNDLDLSGSTLSLKNANGTVLDSVTLPEASVYTAGDGLQLTGTEFKAKAGDHVSVTDNGINVLVDGAVAENDTGLVSGGDVYTAVNTEKTARETAITGEATVRSDADTALQNNIDTLSNVAVKYDNVDTKDKVTLAGTDGTTIDNVKDAVLSATSKEAVTGSQLFVTNTNIAAEITNRTNADTELGARIGTVSADGYYIKASSTYDVAQNLGALDTAIKTANDRIDGLSDNDTTYTAGNGLQLSGTEFSAKAGSNVTVNSDGINVVGNGTVASGNTGLISGGTLYSEGRVASDGNYVQVGNTIAGNLTALDTQVKVNADALADEVTNRTTSVTNEATARADADSALGTRIDGTVKNLTLNGTTLTVTKGDNTTSTLTLQDTDTIYTAGDGLELDNEEFKVKAGTNVTVDANGVSVAGNGTVASGNTGLISGGTLHSEVRPVSNGNYITTTGTTGSNLTALDTAVNNLSEGKADVALSNIDNVGKTVVRNLAKESVNVVSGTHTTVTEGVAGEAKTYAVNVTADGVIAENDIGLVTGGTVYTALNTEKTARETADTTLQGNIDTEATTRGNEDTRLAELITAEETARQGADTTLQSNITAEETARIAGDTALDDRIGTLSVDGNYIRQVNNVSQNLVTLDGQVKANADAIVANKTKYFGVNAQFEEWTDSNAEALKTKYNVETKEEYDVLVSNGLNISGEGAVGVNSIAMGIGAVASGSDNVVIGNGSKADSYLVGEDTVQSSHSTVIGYENITKGVENVAVGYKANISGHDAVAVGSRLSAEDVSVVIGADSASVSSNSIAIGDRTHVGGNASRSVAIGIEANVASTNNSGGSAVAIGDRTVASNTDAIALGRSANATGNGSLSVGASAVAVCSSSSAIGYATCSLAENATAVGYIAKAYATNASAFGTRSEAKGSNSVALGNVARGVSNSAVAIGDNSLASGERSIAIGGTYNNSAEAIAPDAIALGSGSKARSLNALAIGVGNNVTGLNSIAVGSGLTVHGANSGAFGDPSVINANNSYSVGNNNALDGGLSDVFVLGNNVTATNTDTVILGSGSEAKEDHVVSVGRAEVRDGDTVTQTAINRRIVNVGAGVNDTDAVNVSQLTTGLDEKANVVLDNISDAGKTVIQNATNVVSGDSVITVTPNTENGVKTYTVTANVSPDGQIAESNIGLVSGGTVYSEVRPSQDGNYIATANSTGANLSALDNQVKTNADAITTNTTDISNLKNLSNITESGETVITNLAKGSVNVVGTDKATVTKSDVSGVDTYTVSVKADGQVAQGNENLVSGGIVYNALQSQNTEIQAALDGKSNVGLNNITDDGKAVVRALAQESLKVVNGSNTMVTEGTDGTYKTYAVTAKTDGSVADGDAGIVTGGAVYDAIQDAVSDLGTSISTNLDSKANTSLNNVTDAGHSVIKTDAKSAVNVVGGTYATVDKTDVNGVDTYTVNVATDGVVADGNAKLVTGGTVYSALQSQNTELQTALDGKSNVGLDNITDDGKSVVRTLAQESVKVVNGTNTTVTEGTDGTYKIYAVNTKTDGSVADGDTGIVTGGAVYDAIQDAVGDLGTSISTNLDGKANISLNNVTDVGHSVIKADAKSVLNVTGSGYVSVTKTDVDGVDTYAVNVSASGSVADGNTGLVTGDTVYDEVRPVSDGNYIAATNTTAANLSALDTQVNANAEALYNKANWDGSNIGRNITLADDEYPDGMTAEQKSEYLANIRQYNLQSWGQALGAGTVTGGDSRLITGDTLHVEVRPAENGTYVKTNNTTGQNLLALDQQLSTVLEGTASQNTAISDLQNEMETKANVGLDNITDAGKTVVRDLAKESVKVVNGTNTTVTEGTDGNAKTYAVNAVTDGAVADGNTGIVTGGTVYSAIQDMIDGKANVALDNVTEAGHTVIKTDAKSAVNVTGNSDVTVTKTDVDGVDTYNVAVVKTGTVTDGNEGVVTGGTVYDALTAETRPAADGNYIAADHTAGANLTALDTQVKINADAIAVNTTDITNLKDLSNITDAGQTVVKNLAKGSVNVVGANKATVTKTNVDGVDTYTVDVKADGVILADNKGLVDGGTVFDAVVAATGNIIDYTNDGLAGKANVELDNINPAGHTVIKTDAKSAINVTGGTNAEVVKTDVDGVDTYTVNVAGNGQVAENNTGLMNGGTVYAELRPTDGNYVRNDATTAANLSALDTKIGTVTNGDFVQASNTVGQNLNALDEALYDKANWDGSNIGRNTVVTEDDYPAGLTDEQKAEYAANLREYNLQSWGQALGAGMVKGGDSRLITGDTLHVEVRPANSGTYVKVDKTTGENLLALDEQLSSVVNGASAQNTTINNLENEMANKANIALDNINADGVNVVRNIAKSAVVVADGSNTTVSSSTDTDGNITYRVTANATGTVTEGNTGLVDGGTVYTAIENAKNSMGEEVGGLDADGNYIRKANTVAENLVALDTQVKTNADGLVAEQTARETADTALGNRIGTLTADGNYITKDSPVSENLSSLDTAVKSVRDKADSNTADITNLKDLSNITAAGETVIKDLAKGSVKVINGTRTTVTEGTDGDTKTFAVNVDADGTVTDGNTGLVTGDTVYDALQNVQGSVTAAMADKANVSLDNLDADGINRVRDISKSAVSVANGTNTTASSETDADGNVIYKVNVAANGSVASGNAGIMSGGMMYDELRPADGNYVARSSTTAANLTALDAAVKEAMTKAETAQAVTGGNVVVYDTDDRSSVTLGGADGTAIHNVADGAVTADSKDAVTGGQLYTVKSAVDANATAIAGLDTRVQDNTTAIDTLRTTVTNGLDGKTDTDLGNLTDAGKDAVRDLAKESVRVADGVNTTVRTMVDGDASVYHVDVAANGRVESGNTGIVTGDAVYEAIRDIEINASDTHYVSINPSEKDDETFANHGASGTDAVAIGAKSYASGDESVAIGHNNDVSGNETYVIGSDVNATGNNSVVLGKGSDGSLDNVVSVGSAGNERRIVHVADGELSADSKDAVNGKQLYEVREKLQNAEGIDVDKWSDALGSGSVAPGDERLVKGSTVYSAIQSTGISLSPDGSTMNVGAANNATVVDFTNSEGNGRVLQGIVTDPGNPNSAANVGYVNAIGQNIVNGVNSGLNRLDTKINKVGAGAAALASLAPMPFDDDQKWSVSAAIGTYHGTQAGAVGVFYKPQDNVMLNIRGAIGNGENMGGAGLSIGLNKGAAKGLSKSSMAKAMNAQANEIVAQKQLIENQQAQLDAQKAEIEELKQMVRSVVASKQVDK